MSSFEYASSHTYTKSSNNGGIRSSIWEQDERMSFRGYVKHDQNSYKPCKQWGELWRHTAEAESSGLLSHATGTCPRASLRYTESRGWAQSSLAPLPSSLRGFRAYSSLCLVASWTCSLVPEIPPKREIIKIAVAVAFCGSELFSR